MIKLIKDIWGGPFPVKLSFAFLVFVLFCMLLVSPGQILFTLALLYAVLTIANHLVGNDE